MVKKCVSYGDKHRMPLKHAYAHKSTRAAISHARSHSLKHMNNCVNTHTRTHTYASTKAHTHKTHTGAHTRTDALTCAHMLKHRARICFRFELMHFFCSAAHTALRPPASLSPFRTQLRLTRRHASRTFRNILPIRYAL